ncbi:interleukin-15 receptor subunit alpha isoform X1 [Paralichthys olivaceus]|uniref:interleukin-15 receptor subunit alpha isoform X1 n=1 Tax=Paralichthys olivaceus TaxID=8255 RepID=UPI00097D42C3|nr:PREDICTED: interleukin-15 receptor subunit alpha isoform X1 [Paralichthys olivaceus]
MVLQMDPRSLCLSLCAVIASLLAAARCSSVDKNNCSCAEIPQMPRTKPPPENCSDTFRYTCEDGYVRKVGTSNLIKCWKNNSPPKWNKSTLQCIPDPRRTTTRPPMIPVTTVPFTDLQMNGSFSTAVVLESNSVQSTSLGVQGDHSQATYRTTPDSSNQSPSNRTDNSHLSGHSDQRLGTTTTTLIVCASLVIACTLIGISYACYRRRSQNNYPLATDEEKMSMSTIPAGPVS